MQILILSSARIPEFNRFVERSRSQSARVGCEQNVRDGLLVTSEADLKPTNHVIQYYKYCKSKLSAHVLIEYTYKHIIIVQVLYT